MGAHLSKSTAALRPEAGGPVFSRSLATGRRDIREPSANGNRSCTDKEDLAMSGSAESHRGAEAGHVC